MEAFHDTVPVIVERKAKRDDDRHERDRIDVLLPGTVLSSYFGAHVAEHQYIYAIAFLAIAIACCLPLYYYRDHLVKRLHKPKARGSKA